MAVLRQVPIAEQVTSELHRRILDREYSPGERLPSESELADEMRVSRGSVRSAMASLAAAGLVDRRQGDGTYVRDVMSAENTLMHAIWEFSQLIEAGGRNPSVQVKALDLRPAAEAEADALDIQPGDEVVWAVRTFLADDRPLIFSTNVSPASIFTTGFDDLDATYGLHGFLRRYTNQEVARLDADISATIAEGRVRDALALAPDTPILRLEQVFYNVHRYPLVLAINYLCDHALSLRDVRPWYPWHRV